MAEKDTVAKCNNRQITRLPLCRTSYTDRAKRNALIGAGIMCHPTAVARLMQITHWIKRDRLDKHHHALLFVANRTDSRSIIAASAPLDGHAKITPGMSRRTAKELSL